MSDIYSYVHEGKQYFTHQTWYSQVQINRLKNFNEATRSNAWLAGCLATLAQVILFRRSLLKIVRPSYLGYAFASGTFLIFSQVNSHIFNLLSENNHTNLCQDVQEMNSNYNTPYWADRNKVVDLRKYNHALFLKRREHTSLNKEDFLRYKPDLILSKDSGSNKVILL